jgi:hypothetical protein
MHKVPPFLLMLLIAACDSDTIQVGAMHGNAHLRVTPVAVAETTTLRLDGVDAGASSIAAVATMDDMPEQVKIVFVRDGAGFTGKAHFSMPGTWRIRMALPARTNFLVTLK